MASHFSSNSSAFLALPVEIRRQIYGFCIPQKLRYDVSSTRCYRNCPDWFNEISDYHPHGSGMDVIEIENSEERERELSTEVEEIYPIYPLYPFVEGDHRNGLPGLLLCCHQITEEVMDMLYGENTFQVNIQDNDELTLANLLSSKTREKICNMVLILRPRGVSYRPNFRMDPDIWDGILGNLQILGVIAEQPELDSEEQQLEATEPEDAFEEWTTWITPILEYLRQALNREARIVVDANDEQRTVEIIKEAIPGRCHFQCLPIADFIFRRGKFVLESGFGAGYWDDYEPTSCRDIIDDCDYDYYYSD